MGEAPLLLVGVVERARVNRLEERVQLSRGVSWAPFAVLVSAMLYVLAIALLLI